MHQGNKPILTGVKSIRKDANRTKNLFIINIDLEKNQQSVLYIRVQKLLSNIDLQVVTTDKTGWISQW